MEDSTKSAKGTALLPPTKFVHRFRRGMAKDNAGMEDLGQQRVTLERDVPFGY